MEEELAQISMFVSVMEDILETYVKPQFATQNQQQMAMSAGSQKISFSFSFLLLIERSIYYSVPAFLITADMEAAKVLIN